MTVDNMFHDFAIRRRQGNRSIVGTLIVLVPFFEECREVSSRPAFWVDLTLVIRSLKYES